MQTAPQPWLCEEIYRFTPADETSGPGTYTETGAIRFERTFEDSPGSIVTP